MLRLLALVLLAIAVPAVAQQPFASERISVEVTGTGPDVVLVPGLSSSPRVWDTTVAAVPGHRYHLIHVSGFDGQAPGANATGPVLVPVAEEIARHRRRISIIRDHRPFGRQLALIVAARHQGPVSRVMVVDMMPYLGAMFRRPARPTPTSRRAPDARDDAERCRRPAADGDFVDDFVDGEDQRAPAVIASRWRAIRSRPGHVRSHHHQSGARIAISACRSPCSTCCRRTPLTAEQLDNYYRLSYQAAPQRCCADPRFLSFHHTRPAGGVPGRGQGVWAH